MEVSRIEAAPTKIIDWRRLTAKEIIKYNNDGVEVPPQYLKWAIDFRQDLEKNDKDDITYEMAEKQKIEDARKEDNVEENAAAEEETTQAAVSAEGDATESNPAEDVNNKTPAEKKREDMQNEGASLLKQGVVFIKDSNRANKEDLQAAAEVKNAETSSTNEIETLEGEMSALISRAESTQSALKDEIESINSNRSNKMTFAKINRLQQKLQQYGEMGQTRLASSEGDFNQYEAIINSKDGIILNAKDFGTATAGIGHELINHANKGWTLDIISFMLGQYAVGTGNHTVSNADKTDELKNEASQTNKANESQVNSLKNEVQNVTGVEGFSITADGEQEAEDKEKIEKQTAAATETDKAASASLDQVLMAKIRKGQDVEA